MSDDIGDAFAGRFGLIGAEPSPLAKGKVMRTTAQERKAILVHGPGTDNALAGAVELPAQRRVMEKYRSSKAFLAEVRKSLDPVEVGNQLAGLWAYAVEKHDVRLLKLLVPYVLGMPEKSEEDKSGGGILEELLAAVTPMSASSGGKLAHPRTISVSEYDEYSDDEDSLDSEE